MNKTTVDPITDCLIKPWRIYPVEGGSGVQIRIIRFLRLLGKVGSIEITGSFVAHQVNPAIPYQDIDITVQINEVSDPATLQAMLETIVWREKGKLRGVEAADYILYKPVLHAQIYIWQIGFPSQQADSIVLDIAVHLQRGPAIFAPFSGVIPIVFQNNYFDRPTIEITDTARAAAKNLELITMTSPPGAKALLRYTRAICTKGFHRNPALESSLLGALTNGFPAFFEDRYAGQFEKHLEQALPTEPVARQACLYTLILIVDDSELAKSDKLKLLQTLRRYLKASGDQTEFQRLLAAGRDNFHLQIAVARVGMALTRLETNAVCEAPRPDECLTPDASSRAIRQPIKLGHSWIVSPYTHSYEATIIDLIAQVLQSDGTLSLSRLPAEVPLDAFLASKDPRALEIAFGLAQTLPQIVSLLDRLDSSNQTLLEKIEKKWGGGVAHACTLIAKKRSQAITKGLALSGSDDEARLAVQRHQDDPIPYGIIGKAWAQLAPKPPSKEPPSVYRHTQLRLKKKKKKPAPQPAAVTETPPVEKKERSLNAQELEARGDFLGALKLIKPSKKTYKKIVALAHKAGPKSAEFLCKVPTVAAVGVLLEWNPVAACDLSFKLSSGQRALLTKKLLEKLQDKGRHRKLLDDDTVLKALITQKTAVETVFNILSIQDPKWVADRITVILKSKGWARGNPSVNYYKVVAMVTTVKRLELAVTMMGHADKAHPNYQTVGDQLATALAHSGDERALLWATTDSPKIAVMRVNIAAKERRYGEIMPLLKKVPVDERPSCAAKTMALLSNEPTLASLPTIEELHALLAQVPANMTPVDLTLCTAYHKLGKVAEAGVLCAKRSSKWVRHRGFAKPYAAFYDSFILMAIQSGSFFLLTQANEMLSLIFLSQPKHLAAPLMHGPATYYIMLAQAMPTMPPENNDLAFDLLENVEQICKLMNRDEQVAFLESMTRAMGCLADATGIPLSERVYANALDMNLVTPSLVTQSVTELLAAAQFALFKETSHTLLDSGFTKNLLRAEQRLYDIPTEFHAARIQALKKLMDCVVPSPTNVVAAMAERSPRQVQFANEIAFKMIGWAVNQWKLKNNELVVLTQLSTRVMFALSRSPHKAHAFVANDMWCWVKAKLLNGGGALGPLLNSVVEPIVEGLARAGVQVPGPMSSYPIIIDEPKKPHMRYTLKPPIWKLQVDPMVGLKMTDYLALVK